MRPDLLASIGAPGMGSQLAALAAKAAEKVATAATLKDQVCAALEEHLKPHVVHAEWRPENTLLIKVDSGAWCAWVKYAENTLREHLLAAGERPLARLSVAVGRRPPPTP